MNSTCILRFTLQNQLPIKQVCLIQNNINYLHQMNERDKRRQPWKCNVDQTIKETKNKKALHKKNYPYIDLK